MVLHTLLTQKVGRSKDKKAGMENFKKIFPKAKTLIIGKVVFRLKNSFYLRQKIKFEYLNCDGLFASKSCWKFLSIAG